MSKFFEDLKEGLEQLIAYKKGEVKLRTTRVTIAAPSEKYKAKSVRQIREKYKYLQSILAQIKCFY